MRRLAIFDPARGQQPMTTPDGRHTIVFNGAIYNFRALRAELEGAGSRFQTDCDTEVLLAAYARWGAACLGRLQGMFAFAVWDAHRSELFLARDPFGIKPLYFWEQSGRLLFASEIAALRASGVLSPRIDVQAVSDYLGWFAVPAPRTIFAEIGSLRPGECAVWAEGRLTRETHWSFGSLPAGGRPCSDRAEFVRVLRSRLEETIRAHIAADVPVGAFLSGGLDSAAIVGLMTRESGRSLKTFSIDFREPGYSEADAAAATARHYGTRHESTTLTGGEVASRMEEILSAFDQPTGDGINTYLASEAARRGGVAVALSGLGGDELFGGYPSFRDIPRLARWLPTWGALPGPLRSAALGLLRAGGTRERKLADLLAHSRSTSELASLQRRVFDGGSARELLHRDLRSAFDRQPPHHPALAELGPQLAGSGDYRTISAWELRTYMADVLLRDSDVMSMRHSLELRVPFIDRPFIEWLWRQPPEFRDDRRHPKSALAEALADILPPAMADRRKQGFTLPLALWMKAELKPFLEDTFSESNVARSGLFAAPEVARRWRGFVSGSDNREWSRLWSLAVLVHFVNRREAPRVARVAPNAPACASHAEEASPARSRPQDGGLGASRATLPASRLTSHDSRHSVQTLLLVPEIFEKEGGIPRALQAYLKALCELNGATPSVRLLALNDSVMDSADLRRCSTDALKEWRVCGRDKTRFVRAALGMSAGCERLVCGHIGQLPVAWMARKVNPRLKYYLIAHGIEVWRRFGPVEKLALRGAERILCVSDYTRRELLRNCPGIRDTAVLPNALDPAFEIRPGSPLGRTPPTLLVVTRLTKDDRYKGVDHLIEAMPAIRAAVPGARLRIIGRGDDMPYLRGKTGALGLGDAVEFLGYVDDAAMEEAYASCRLFALPSRKEGFGIVFLEAMARGRPCLGARAGGVPEVIDAASGVLVAFGDVPGIARAAVDALRRDWDESAILDRARHFTYDRFRDRLAALLSQ